MRIFSTLLILIAAQSSAFAEATRAKCYKDFRVCWFWKQASNGAIVNNDDLPADFVEQQTDGPAFSFYCFGVPTGLINEVSVRPGLPSDGVLCGETYAAPGQVPQPCGYVRWDRNDTSCQEP